MKCQGPITPLGVLCENSLGSTNVTGLVVNIEGANGFFFLLTTLDLGIMILLVVFHCHTWSMDLMMVIMFK